MQRQGETIDAAGGVLSAKGPREFTGIGESLDEKLSEDPLPSMTNK